LFQTADWGIDGEVGRVIPGIEGLTAYLGGYYFNGNKAKDTKGVSGRMEYALNPNVSLTLHNSYDNVEHNTLLMGLKLSLGGTNNSSRDRSEIGGRLLDPINRNLATLGNGNGTPIRNELVNASGQLL